MAVRLTIADGPPGQEWLSDDLRAGIVTPGPGGTAAFQAVGTLQTGVPYGFRVRVRNDGDDDATVPARGTTGPFVAPALGVGGSSTSSCGTTQTASSGARVRTRCPGGTFRDVTLEDRNGTTLFVQPAVAGTQFAWAFCPDGSVLAFVGLRQGPALPQVTLSIVAAEEIPGHTPIASGTAIVDSEQHTLPEGPFTFATAGWGFAPGSSAFATAIAMSGELTVTAYALRPDIVQRKALAFRDFVRTGQRWLFSPADDLLAVIGGVQSGDDVVLTALTEIGLNPLNPWRPTDGGKPVGALRVNGPNPRLLMSSLSSIHGIELRDIRHALGTATIDAPGRLENAVQVWLWISNLGGYIAPGTSTQLPEGARESASGWIRRIPAGRTADCIVAADWVPQTPGHRCAVAEAFSTPAAVPADKRIRTSSTSFDVFGNRQEAQRNLEIVGAHPSGGLTPFAIHNPDAKVSLDVTVRLVQAEPKEVAADQFLGRFAPEPLELSHVGLVTYDPRSPRAGDLDPVDEISLSLSPRETATLAVYVEATEEPDPQRLQAAMVRIVEERSDGQVGGLTVIAATDPARFEETEPRPEAPSPLTIVDGIGALADPYDIDAGDPVPEFVIGRETVWMAATVANLSKQKLIDVTVALESVGIPGCRPDPRVHRAELLMPEETFRVTFGLDLRAAAAGAWPVTFVVEDHSHQPTRLLGRVQVVDPDA